MWLRKLWKGIFYSTDMWSMEKTKQKQNKTKEQRAKKYLSSSCCFPSVTHRLPKLNRPLPSSKNPHFQNKARSTTFLVKMSFICMRMKNDFHIKGWAPTLVLKQRPGGTRKWPIWFDIFFVTLQEHTQKCSGSFYVYVKLPTYPSPETTFCPK